MNDADTLKQHNIKDGLTVHLVIKTPPRPEPEGGPRRPPGNPPTTDVYTTTYTIYAMSPCHVFTHLSLKKKLFFLADVGATPFGLNSLGGLAGLESLGLGQSTFMDLQVRNSKSKLNNRVAIFLHWLDFLLDIISNCYPNILLLLAFYVSILFNASIYHFWLICFKN